MVINGVTQLPTGGLGAEAGMVPVLAAPMIDPGRNRIRIELPYGLTIADIIDLVLPGGAGNRDYLRVALVTDRGSQIIPRSAWHRVFPHAGVHVVISAVPGKDALRQILSVVVAIAAVALGAYFAPMLAGTFGIGQAGWQGIIALGVTVVGNLLINALIPPPKPDDSKVQSRHSITGWKNRIDPNGALPFILGEIRFAPPFAAMPHSEVVGDFLYVRALFCPGPGELQTDDYRIGETSIAEYDKFEIQPRDGVAGDLPVTLFPQQRVEESVGAELLMPYPRDEFGEIIPDSEPEESPITRTTGPDASGASVILTWPGGLFSVEKKKGKLRSHSVTIKIEHRQVQAEEWQDVETLVITARKRESFYRQHTWKFPTRGRWQVRVTMLTPETEDMQLSQKTAWAAFQTIRPEYPINYPDPLALVGVRIKSTHQLSGQLDNFNFVARRVCLDWDNTSGTWIKRATRNPASLFRLVLQHKANARPVPDAGIDLEQLQDWHNFCRINGLKYDRAVEDPETKIGELLSEIAAAGRAAKRHDGARWGVVIDRPRSLLTIDDYSPRNSYGFKASRSYVRHPDAIVVNFLDATNDYKAAQRIVPWLGQTGEIRLTETLDLPGKTDPSEVYRETYRRMLETVHRPDVYRLSLDGPITTATRGDKVNVSHAVIEATQVASRVRAVSDNLVVLDDMVTMEAVKQYGLQFRVFADDNDAIGTSVVRTVVTHAGETSSIVLSGDGPKPQSGDLVHFGVAGKESLQLIVSGIEAGEDFSQHLRLIDAAPIIDELLDAVEIPAWSGRVGDEIGQNLLQPAAPIFTSIASGMAGTDQVNRITFLVEPGSSSIVVSRFRIDHRLVGAPAWTALTIPVANGGGQIDAYANGQAVEMRGTAISVDDVAGPSTLPISVTVGSGDAAIPSSLDDTKISVVPLIGGAAVQFVTGDDSQTAQVQIYRSMSAVLNRLTDAVGDPLLVQPSRSYTQPAGDATRENLLLNGAMDTAGTWSLGAGWAIASGKATKTAGSASSLSQPLAATAGKFYRVSFDLSAFAAGTLTPQLTGGTTRSGTARSANGTFTDRIQAVTGNATFGLAGSSTFAGSVDNAVVYLETATCLAQGVHYFWLEPQNEDGVPGPVSGPFTVTIR